MKVVSTASSRTSRSMIVTVMAGPSFFLIFGASASAQVPEEFHGDWSSHPSRCKQENGEVDLLTIEERRLGFYEVGCEELTKPKGGQAGSTAFEAMCFKGGSPETKGQVELRREGENVLHLKLTGFAWSSPAVQTFYKCQRRE